MLGSPGGVLGIFMAGARVMGRSVRERLAERLLMRDCPFFEPIVAEDDAVKMRSYLASLLAWDLAQHQQSRARRGKRFRLVVFFDTWERVQSAPHRGNAEDLIVRLVHLMPNALFVVTGRNRLRWADDESRAVMQWAGPEHWPYFADAVDVEPRQHLVGGLSNEDSDRFLRRRLVSEGAPVIPGAIRQVIVAAADGLPLYLDLAAVRFAQLTAGGARLTPADFGQPFPEVVLRIMSDLEPDQRCLLRVASLVGHFDDGLLRAGAPHLTDSSLSRFVRRSIVRHRPTDYAPFSIHDTLREAVQACDVGEDRWSDREWEQAVRRLLAEIQQRVEPELGAGGSTDGALLTGLFKEAFGLALRLESAPPWLWQFAGRLHNLGFWDALEWTAGVTPADSALRPAAAALAAIEGRWQCGPAATAVELQACLADARLDPTGRDYVSYWLGWQLDETHRWDEAERVRLEVARGEGPFTPHLRHALGRGDWVCGRLGRALSWEFDDADAVQRFWSTGLHGRVAWILGRYADAEQLYAERLRAAEQVGSPEFVAHTLRTRAELRCFTTPGDVADATEAVEIYSRLGSTVKEAEAKVCIAVAQAGPEPLERSIELLDATRPALRGEPHADVGEVFVRCLHADVTGARGVRERFSGGQPGRAFGYWVAITGWWVAELSGAQEPAYPANVEWLHGEDDARQRWVEVLNARRVG